MMLFAIYLMLLAYPPEPEDISMKCSRLSYRAPESRHGLALAYGTPLSRFICRLQILGLRPRAVLKHLLKNSFLQDYNS